MNHARIFAITQSRNRSRSSDRRTEPSRHGKRRDDSSSAPRVYPIANFSIIAKERYRRRRTRTARIQRFARNAISRVDARAPATPRCHEAGPAGDRILSTLRATQPNSNEQLFKSTYLPYYHTLPSPVAVCLFPSPPPYSLLYFPRRFFLPYEQYDLYERL